MPLDIDLSDDSRFNISPEELKRIETRWKSDVDVKLDNLVAFAEKYGQFLDMLIERERQRERLRSAIIEKTLSGLILAAVVALFSLAWSGLNADIGNLVRNIRSAK